MKHTSDGIEQLPRVWYYLLDFNDQDNWKTIEDLTGKCKLADLTNNEFKMLFEKATDKDKTFSGQKIKA